MNYPRVVEDGSLIFDSGFPFPKRIPLFTVHPDEPNRFYPTFPDCVHRGTAERRMSDNLDCKRKRRVWYCNKLQKDIFPLDCSTCNEDKTK